MKKTLVHRLAERSPQLYVATLLVSRTHFSLETTKKNREGNTIIENVPEHEAIRRIPCPASSLDDLMPFTQRRRDYYGLIWEAKDEWIGEEPILSVQTKIAEGEYDPAILASQIREGNAEYVPTAATDEQVFTRLHERLAARAYLLEHAHHKVQFYKQARINIDNNRVRIFGRENSRESAPFYFTGLPPLLPKSRMPKTAKDAEKYLKEAVC